MDPERVAVVKRSLTDEARAQFRERVEEQAAFLREELAAGHLDNRHFALGLELEAYAVDDEGRLARLPDPVFEACEKELGLHNLELNTEATVFDPDGVAAQAADLRERVERARAACEREGLELVLDGMWTGPPAGGSRAYLAAVEEVDGVTVAENMRAVPRYWALDNDVLAHAGGSVELSVPGAHLELPTILVESLATSLQPHLQVPRTGEFPRYYNAGIRTLGPVLALATNSPFLPPDLYGRVEDPRALVEATHHELRIAAFEQPMNVGPGRKVCVPRDLDAPADALAAIAADEPCGPFLAEWADDDAPETYADRFPEFDHQRGTYWRWLRPVVGGDDVGAGDDERSLRIEYRPVPTQPTVAENVAVLCLTAGLVRGVVAADHPVADLGWEAARRSFYDAVERGPGADLAWVTADGTPATDTDRIYEEVFALARRGLREQGLAEGDIDEYLRPLERRRERRLAPSVWKKRAVRRRLDAGAGFAAAIEGMQREYARKSRRGIPVVEW